MAVESSRPYVPAGLSGNIRAEEEEEEEEEEGGGGGEREAGGNMHVKGEGGVGRRCWNRGRVDISGVSLIQA